MFFLYFKKKAQTTYTWSALCVSSMLLFYDICALWYWHSSSISASDDDSYILTTDADVRFTPDSVEALLDLMTRDQSVGAVCARTHPLGSGPLVWYQIFEYAIGHWFQKVLIALVNICTNLSEKDGFIINLSILSSSH